MKTALLRKLFAMAYAVGAYRRSFAFGSLVGLGFLALAQNPGEQLASSVTAYLCPVVKFLAGPLAWIGIAVAFMIGLIMLVAGGRGAIRTMVLAFLAGIILVVGKAWINTQLSGNSGNTAKSCLGW